MEVMTILVGIGCIAVGFFTAFFLINSLNITKSKQVIEDAKIEGERIKKDKLLQAKEKFLELKGNHEKSINHKNQELNKAQSRVKEKETKLNQRLGEMNRKEKQVDEIKSTLLKQKDAVEKKQQELDDNIQQQIKQLEEAGAEIVYTEIEFSEWEKLHEV